LYLLNLWCIYWVKTENRLIMEKCVDCFNVTFVENKTKRWCVFEDFPCFGVFWAFRDNMVVRQIHVACVAYLSRFLGDEEVVGEVCITYSGSWYIMTSSLRFKLQEKIYFLVKGLLSLGLFDKGTLVQFFCHVSRILRLMWWRVTLRMWLGLVLGHCEGV